MTRTTKLDRLRAERTEALATLKRAEEAHRAAVAALPETSALASARREHEAASIAYIREHERVQRRAEVRTEYKVREITEDGDAITCWFFDSREDAIGHATRLHAHRPAAQAVAVERERNGNCETIWRRGCAGALEAWEGNATA
jgi:hypothetical protein